MSEDTIRYIATIGVAVAFWMYAYFIATDIKRIRELLDKWHEEQDDD